MITNLMSITGITFQYYDALIFKTEKMSATVFPLKLDTRTADKITLTHTIKRCTYLEKRPHGRPKRLESLL